jgi:hypothetical protein
MAQNCAKASREFLLLQLGILLEKETGLEPAHIPLATEDLNHSDTLSWCRVFTLCNGRTSFRSCLIIAFPKKQFFLFPLSN